MLPNRQHITQENPLWVSWHDTQMMASLNPQNVMDYFCRKSNPFYDRMCNNENIRMQRLGLENLQNMVGLEYILLHVHEPILYVIRKQHRHNVQEATPIADYYMIGGTIYQAPDLGNVISSRILSTVTNLQSAFEEASSYSRYHPNKGYTWDFSSNKQLTDKSKAAAKKDSTTTKDDNGTVFQMHRVDMLLAELLRKFPPPIPPIIHQQHIQQQGVQPSNNTQIQQEANNTNTQDLSSNNTSNNGNNTETSPTGVGSNLGIDIKQENVDMKPPPEKKAKTS